LYILSRRRIALDLRFQSIKLDVSPKRLVIVVLLELIHFAVVPLELALDLSFPLVILISYTCISTYNCARQDRFIFPFIWILRDSGSKEVFGEHLSYGASGLEGDKDVVPVVPVSAPPTYFTDHARSGFDASVDYPFLYITADIMTLTEASMCNNQRWHALL